MVNCKGYGDKIVANQTLTAIAANAEMTLLQFRRYDVLVCLASLALIGSFAWYAYKGPRGFAYRVALDNEIAELQAENASLLAEKVAIERQVRLMRPEHVDPDMLEELARTQLKLLQPNTVIVRLN